MKEFDHNAIEQKYVSDEERDRFITLIKEAFELDLSEYSQASVSRRFTKIFSDLGATSAQECMERLKSEADPKGTFLSLFTVNVTEMFRDPDFYASLVNNVFPILKQREKLRFYSAACSTGEEPISLAILLHEHGLLERSTIIATDISERVLELAKSGKYKKRSMVGYDKAYAAAGGKASFNDYFEDYGESLKVKDFILQSIQFETQNLLEPLVHANFDLVICRNVLIYFNKLLQDDVLERLTNSLLPKNSYLCLGSKESIIFYTNRDRFKEVDREYKIYKRTQ